MNRLRVVNPVVKNPTEHSIEASGDQMQILQRQITFFELPINKGLSGSDRNYLIIFNLILIIYEWEHVRGSVRNDTSDFF